MTTKAHTDITVGAPANAAVINAPLGQIDSALADLASVLGDYVVTGGLAGTSASLVLTQPALRAFIQNTYVVQSATTLTATASKDNYIDLDSAGVYHISVVNNGAAAPAVFALSIRLYKAVASATAVTSVVDLRAGPNLVAQSVSTQAAPFSPYAPASAARAGSAYFSGDPWFDVRAYGAKGDGVTNDITAVNAAIAGAQALGGATVFFPIGNYACSTPPTITSSVGRLRLLGSSMDSQGNPALIQGSALVYTGAVGGGTTTFLNVNAHSGFTMEDLSVQYTNASFTGSLVALPGCEPTRFERVALTASPITLQTCTYLLDLTPNATVFTANDCWFQGSQYAVIGNNAGGSGTANVMTFNSCVFNGSAVANIANPGQAWTFNGCTHEPLSNGKGKAFVLVGTPFAPQGLTINGGWFGDTTDTTAWSWIALQGKGITIRGCYAKGNTNATFLQITGTTSGLEMSGMSIFACLVGVNLGSALVSACHIVGNDWGTAPDTATGTPIAGTMASGMTMDPTNGVILKNAHHVFTPTVNAGEVVQITDVNGLTFADFSSDSGNRRLDLVNLLAGFNIYSDSFTTLQFSVSNAGVVTQRGKTTSYNNITTQGMGLPAIYRAPTPAVNQTAAIASFTTITSPNDGATHIYEIDAGVLITTLGSGNINAQVTYTDANAAGRTTNIPLCAQAGTWAASATTADDYKGHVVIAVQANTAITIKTAGTFTGCTYNFMGAIKQVL